MWLFHSISDKNHTIDNITFNVVVFTYLYDTVYTVKKFVQFISLNIKGDIWFK